MSEMDCCPQAHDTTNNTSETQNKMNCNLSMNCSMTGISLLLPTAHLFAYSTHADPLSSFFTITHYVSPFPDNPQRPPRPFV